VERARQLAEREQISQRTKDALAAANRSAPLRPSLIPRVFAAAGV